MNTLLAIILAATAAFAGGATEPPESQLTCAEAYEVLDELVNLNVTPSSYSKVSVTPPQVFKDDTFSCRIAADIKGSVTPAGEYTASGTLILYPCWSETRIAFSLGLNSQQACINKLDRIGHNI